MSTLFFSTDEPFLLFLALIFSTMSFVQKEDQWAFPPMPPKLFAGGVKYIPLQWYRHCLPVDWGFQNFPVFY